MEGVVRRSLADLGELGLMTWGTLRYGLRRPFGFALLVEQFYQIGVMSLSIVCIVALFTGLVIALQTAHSLGQYGGQVFIGDLVALSLVRELGPVLTSLMIAGRVGAGITAELGSMAVTEQVDAIRALAANPIKKLVVPRVLATVIMVPLLVVLANIIGILGGLAIAVTEIGQTPAYFLQHVTRALDLGDVAASLIKAACFGLITSLIACHRGLAVKGGAAGVGAATTRTVVAASISILVSDFFITKFLLWVLGVTGEPFIRYEGVEKAFGSNQVLRGVDLSVYEGETVVVLGGSGTGKSVLLKHTIGLLYPDAGRVYVEGEEVTNLSEDQFQHVRKKVSMLFQAGALFDSMSVFENVAYALREHTEMSEQQIRDKVAEVLSHVELPGLEELMPVELSGGMRRRVALARAIALEPRGLLYDEPTTGLDPLTADTINRLIRRLQKTLKVTSIVVTHDILSTRVVADRIAWLLEGRMEFIGTLAEAMASGSETLRRFLVSGGGIGENRHD